VDWPAKIRSVLSTQIFVLRKRDRSPGELARSRTTARKVGRFIALAVAFAVLLFTGWRTYLACDVRTRIHAIKSQNLPANGAELDLWYRQIPPADNVALKLTNAFTHLKRFSNAASRVFDISPAHNRPLAGEDRQLAFAFVATNKDVLEAVANAVATGHARYPVDLSAGYATLLPHLADLKTCAQIADFNTRKALEAGDVVEATRSCDVILKLAHTLDDEPVLISQLVRTAIVRIAVRNLECQLCARQLSEAEINHWLPAFAEVQRTNQMTTALIGERAMVIQAFRSDVFKNWPTPESDEKVVKKPRNASGIERALIFASGFFERDLNFTLETMASAIDYSRKPAPEDFAADTVFRRKGAEASRKLYLLSSMLLPAYSRVIMRHETEMASLELAQAALRIEKALLLQGHIPQDAEEAANSNGWPMDPFAGEPIKYKRTTKGYVLYSLGSDKIDDDAKEEPYRPKPTDRWDITFFVEH
jgi:hypothetical protein